MATLLPPAARQGRHNQRYTKTGGRLIVGCVPYRLRSGSLEVLVITSQKGQGMMFPKGGWESDETRRQAASREAAEEAGVKGRLGAGLGRWAYISKRFGTTYEVAMFPLTVTEEMEDWPEKEARRRRWVSVDEAREGCQHSWMVEALDNLVMRLSLLKP